MLWGVGEGDMLPGSMVVSREVCTKSCHKLELGGVGDTARDWPGLIPTWDAIDDQKGGNNAAHGYLLHLTLRANQGPPTRRLNQDLIP